VLFSVYLDHDTCTIRGEQEEVHTLPWQLCSYRELPSQVGAVMQIHLGNERRHVPLLVDEVLAKGPEQQLLRRDVSDFASLK
jgi:hypothetical protein